MNRDDVIRMAQECGLTVNYTHFPRILHFADRVAAAERNRETALLRQAFEALDWGGGTYEKRCDAIAALQERLRETP